MSVRPEIVIKEYVQTLFSLCFFVILSCSDKGLVGLYNVVGQDATLW